MTWPSSSCQFAAITRIVHNAMFMLTFLTGAATAFSPHACTSSSLPCRAPIVSMGFSWVPPPRGAQGQPLRAPIVADEQAMIERACAARNAGIDGYRTGIDAIKEASAAASEEGEHAQTVDVWTFGTDMTGRIADAYPVSTNADEAKKDDAKFNLLKKALAKLTKSRASPLDY